MVKTGLLKKNLNWAHYLTIKISKKQLSNETTSYTQGCANYINCNTSNENSSIRKEERINPLTQSIGAESSFGLFKSNDEETERTSKPNNTRAREAMSLSKGRLRRSSVGLKNAAKGINRIFRTASFLKTKDSKLNSSDQAPWNQERENV
uniref:Uncharacterized protein n=1 Tax=Aplanochytrium stocchinoi TaxID=215587 RepID=A0A7S3LJG9_9STRA